jgi:hypothetical protein
MFKIKTTRYRNKKTGKTTVRHYALVEIPGGRQIPLIIPEKETDYVFGPR